MNAIDSKDDFPKKREFSSIEWPSKKRQELRMRLKINENKKKMFKNPLHVII